VKKNFKYNSKMIPRELGKMASAKTAPKGGGKSKPLGKIGKLGKTVKLGKSGKTPKLGGNVGKIGKTEKT
jgi:hypothetical protein